MRFRRACVLPLVLSAVVCGQSRHGILPAESLLHKPAPRFVRRDLQHHRIDLAAYKGHVVLLNFWATWCAPCQIELPRFAAWQRQYGPQELQILAVSMDDDQDSVLEFTRKHPLPFPVLMGDENLGGQYGGVLGLPMTFLIDRNGAVASIFKGETSPDQIEAEVRRLLDTR